MLRSENALAHLLLVLNCFTLFEINSKLGLQKLYQSVHQHFPLYIHFLISCFFIFSFVNNFFFTPFTRRKVLCANNVFVAFSFIILFIYFLSINKNNWIKTKKRLYKLKIQLKENLDFIFSKIKF